MALSWDCLYILTESLIRTQAEMRAVTDVLIPEVLFTLYYNKWAFLTNNQQMCGWFKYTTVTKNSFCSWAIKWTPAEN